jgi:hypothetical protein
MRIESFTSRKILVLKNLLRISKFLASPLATVGNIFESCEKINEMYENYGSFHEN